MIREIKITLDIKKDKEISLHSNKVLRNCEYITQLVSVCILGVLR